MASLWSRSYNGDNFERLSAIFFHLFSHPQTHKLLQDKIYQSLKKYLSSGAANFFKLKAGLASLFSLITK
jgi:hypothetical protein